MAYLYATGLSTDYGTPADLNPNDWPVGGNDWHTQPSSGLKVRYVGPPGGADLYIRYGCTATFGDGLFFDGQPPSYIGDGARIGAWTAFSGTSYIGDRATIGEGCRFGQFTGVIGDDVTIGNQVTIGNDLNINDGSVIESDWVIGDDLQMGQGCRIGSAS